MILVATAKMRRVELPVTLRRTHSHSISLGTIFYGKKNEIMDYFYRMGRMSYNLE